MRNRKSGDNLMDTKNSLLLLIIIIISAQRMNWTPDENKHSKSHVITIIKSFLFKKMKVFDSPLDDHWLQPTHIDKRENQLNSKFGSPKRLNVHLMLWTNTKLKTDFKLS